MVNMNLSHFSVGRPHTQFLLRMIEINYGGKKENWLKPEVSFSI